MPKLAEYFPFRVHEARFHAPLPPIDARPLFGDASRHQEPFGFTSRSVPFFLFHGSFFKVFDFKSRYQFQVHLDPPRSLESMIAPIDERPLSGLTRLRLRLPARRRRLSARARQPP